MYFCFCLTLMSTQGLSITDAWIQTQLKENNTLCPQEVLMVNVACMHVSINKSQSLMSRGSLRVRLLSAVLTLSTDGTKTQQQIV